MQENSLLAHQKYGECGGAGVHVCQETAGIGKGGIWDASLKAYPPVSKPRCQSSGLERVLSVQQKHRSFDYALRITVKDRVLNRRPERVCSTLALNISGQNGWSACV